MSSARWDDSRLMGAPRVGRGGGSWRKRAASATMVAFVVAAFVGGLAQPVAADDPLTEALKRKDDLQRAVALARANTERYQTVAGQYQSVVNDANAKIADLAAKADDAQSEADQLYYEIQIAEEQLALVTFQLDETRALADSLNAQAAEEEKQLATREDLYARHLRATYRQAMISPLEMLLSSASLTEFADRLQAMIFINREDVQLANDIRALRASTSQKQSDASAKEKDILGLQNQITSTRKTLAAQKDHYDQLVAEAKAAIDQQASVRAAASAQMSAAQGQAAQSKGQTADLQFQLDNAEAEYAMLAAQGAGGSGLGAFNGRLVMWPVRGPITSPFGPRWGAFHNGVDIAAPMYTPVVAPYPGIVTTVGRPYLAYGDTAVVVIIAHGNNFSTLSGHLDDRHWPPVQVGQAVRAGQVVGYIGMTGFTTGPHDHFMTILNGRAVNPMLYLP
jgi:murein DD-endopeptidase MepM/ murein hydrolase activator NlpD